MSIRGAHAARVLAMAARHRELYEHEHEHE